MVLVAISAGCFCRWSMGSACCLSAPSSQAGPKRLRHGPDRRRPGQTLVHGTEAHSGERNNARFRSGLVRQGVRQRTAANTPGPRKAGFRVVGGRKLRPELRLAASMFDATWSRADLIERLSAGQSLFGVGGGCGIRTREGLHPTRFPNPQTEVQMRPQVFVYACETTCRTLPDADRRGQLRPKLRPHSPSGSTLNTADKMMCIVSLNPGSISRELIAQTVCVGNPTMSIAIRRPQTHETLSGKRRGEHPTPKASKSTL